MKNRPQTEFLLGAYAAAPPAPYSEGVPGTELRRFSEGVRALPGVGGLELPFTSSGLTQPVGPAPSEQLAAGWRFAVTALPGQMETMKVDAAFGLASDDEGGRKRAVEFARRLMQETRALLHERKDVHVCALEFHSGPRPMPESGLTSSAGSLRRSLQELSDDTDLFAKIAIEHCDAFGGAGLPAKGFLSLEDEMRVASEFGLGHVLNWGRSALEGHSADTPLAHLRRAASALRGFIFSGASTAHPLYGDWQDSHAPIREEGLGSDRSLLLTRARVSEILREMPSCREGTAPFVGLKVQALPRELSVEERIAFLKRQLELLGSCVAEVSESSKRN